MRGPTPVGKPYSRGSPHTGTRMQSHRAEKYGGNEVGGKGREVAVQPSRAVIVPGIVGEERHRFDLSGGVNEPGDRREQGATSDESCTHQPARSSTQSTGIRLGTWGRPRRVGEAKTSFMGIRRGLVNPPKKNQKNVQPLARREKRPIAQHRCEARAKVAPCR